MGGSETGHQLGQHQVAIDVPASATSLRLLRLGVADRATALGLSSEAIERGRVVVDELAAVVMAAAPASRLRVVVAEEAGHLRLDGAMEHDGACPRVDDVVRELLDLCVAPFEWDVRVGDGFLRFDATIGAR